MARPLAGIDRRVLWGSMVACSLASAVLALALVPLRPSAKGGRRAADSPPAQFVGSGTCASCHAGEAAAWQASQHRAAMSLPTPTSVRGDFADARFTYAGTTNTFSKRGEQFVVRTDGADGKRVDLEVKYTFGVYPLQQYLVELPGGRGRLQALSIAWDARPKQAGGQRWFHLYPNERITHTNELHWTRPLQNWNHQCADCHSTGVSKGYDPGADRFDTKWKEISVGCEACHGPGSRHAAWAAERAVGKSARAARGDNTKGLTVQLDERRDVAWSQRDAQAVAATRSRPRTTEREIAVCAQCHSLRSQIADGYEAGKEVLDYYRPSLLTSPQYHADGQQRGEVYTWGSFVQSRMYARGVTCSDCHDPHRGTLRKVGNATCANCHTPATYDTPAHHHHRGSSAGASCVGCHMPTSTYMVVDPRHDHGFRVPRPDLSVAQGTPNACTQCHSNRDNQWAAASVRSWGLQRRANPMESPAIIRATVLAQMSGPPTRSSVGVLVQALRDSNVLVRLGASEAVARLPNEYRAPLAGPLLSDAVRAVRLEAAEVLGGSDVVQGLSPEARSALDRAQRELVATQQYNSDRADARVELGHYYAGRGDSPSAIRELETATRLDPAFAPAYVNLADVHRSQGREADAERVLRVGLAAVPASAALHHALGLSLARQRRMPEAVAELSRAAALEPAEARFVYVYAVALDASGKRGEAIARLERALKQHPDDADMSAALARMKRVGR